MHLVCPIHMFHHVNPRWSHRAGAEGYLKNLLAAWIRHGHSATVCVLHKDPEPCTIDGIEVVGKQPNAASYIKADALLTHLDFTQHSMDLAEYWDLPQIHLVHNHAQIDMHKATRKSDLFIFAAHWIQEEALSRIVGIPSITCYPPVHMQDFESKVPLCKRDAIVLSNLNDNKGGDLFEALATVTQSMPEFQNIKWIGIQGAYGDQHMSSGTLPNVELIPHTNEVKKYLDRARAVIIPSRYESFGIWAVEAMAAGVPVVATHTDGLIESVADGGQLIPLSRRDFLDEWIEPLRLLVTDQNHWNFWSRRAHSRVRVLDGIMQSHLRHAIYQIEHAIQKHGKYKRTIELDWEKLVTLLGKETSNGTETTA